MIYIIIPYIPANLIAKCTTANPIRMKNIKKVLIDSPSKLSYPLVNGASRLNRLKLINTYNSRFKATATKSGRIPTPNKKVKIKPWMKNNGKKY